MQFPGQKAFKLTYPYAQQKPNKKPQKPLAKTSKNPTKTQ
jgi:hypothetical protein